MGLPEASLNDYFPWHERGPERSGAAWMKKDDP
jgi:hypothetical protein